MAWYNIGTVAVTNGGTTVTGTGTNWTQYVDAGQGFNGPDGLTYEIAAVVSATQITLARAYRGATAAGQAYSIEPVQGYFRDLALQAADLILSFATVRDGVGAGMFADGSVTVPGVRFANDQDTGIYRIGTNVLGIATNGTERVRVDASGNVGIGTAPVGRLDLSNVSRVRWQLTDAIVREIATNAAANAYATKLVDASEHVFMGSGSEWARLTNGRFGIGTNNPLWRFHVLGSESDLVGFISTGTASGLLVGDSTAAIRLGTRTGNFILDVGAERLRVETGGNVGIGTSSPAAKLHVAGFARISGATGDTFQGLTLRNTADTASVDSVSFVENRNQSDIADSHLFFRHRTDGSSQFELGLTPAGSKASDRRVSKFSVDANGAYSGGDNTMVFGWSGNRWQAIYAVNGAIQTSDLREKKWRGSLNEQELEASRRIAKEIGIFQWIASIEEKGEDAARFHTGVPAQIVFGILTECGLDWRRYAWACFDEWDDIIEPVYEEREVEVPETIQLEIPSSILDARGRPIVRKVDKTFIRKEMQYVPTGDEEVKTPAGDRFGIRPDQLAFWLIAGQEQRLAALEAA
ncbi:tail fiber domain-containing protein [Sphingobium yanoikuyae]|uniref:tail fiber domain-containing protein n=1 Tax=Sphingobium yanoikuyae TaxID=13690 RepID=UPI0035C7387B